MPKFLSTDLPKLKDEEDDRSIKKSILDLLDKINTVADAQYPVGAIYTQYPGTSTPATLFGGTWLNVSSLYAGLFFRAEGGAALAFNGGNQADAIITHRHALGVSGTGSFAFGSTTITSSSVMTLAGAGTNGPNTGDPLTVATASETRPVNTTIRIWQRTGGTLTTTAGTSVTSGIYDSGTNANGSWIRFTDGTMMQWGVVASYTALTTGTGSWKQTPFPLQFIAHYQSGTASTSDWIALSVATSSTGSHPDGTLYLSIFNRGAYAGDTPFNWNALGKWK
jgi:hypothetical protein